MSFFGRLFHSSICGDFLNSSETGVVLSHNLSNNVFFSIPSDLKNQSEVVSRIHFMALSNTKRLHNEMKTLENESDRYVPFDKYYMVKIHTQCAEEIVQEWCKSLLTKYPAHQPMISYMFWSRNVGVILLVYSCLEEGSEHYLHGSHSKIISQYASIISQSLLSSTIVNIIEFDTRTQVLTYLSCLTHHNSQVAMISYSDGKISDSDIKTKTQGELLERLGEIGVKWEDLPAPRKYGVFYRLKKKHGNIVISSLSESFDARNMRKYSSFVFGL